MAALKAERAIATFHSGEKSRNHKADKINRRAQRAHACAHVRTSRRASMHACAHTNTHTHAASSPRNRSDINRGMTTMAAWSLGLMSRRVSALMLMNSDDLERSLN